MSSAAPAQVLCGKCAPILGIDPCSFSIVCDRCGDMWQGGHVLIPPETEEHPDHAAEVSNLEKIQDFSTQGQKLPQDEVETPTKITTPSEGKAAAKSFTRVQLNHRRRIPGDGLPRSFAEPMSASAHSRPRPERLYLAMRPSQDGRPRSCVNCSTTASNKWRRSKLTETAGKWLCDACKSYELCHSRPRPNDRYQNPFARLASGTSPSASLFSAQTQQKTVSEPQDPLHPWTAARLLAMESSQTPARTLELRLASSPLRSTSKHLEASVLAPLVFSSTLPHIPPEKRIVVPHIDDTNLNNPPTIVFQTLSLLADLRNLLCIPHEEQPFDFRGTCSIIADPAVGHATRLIRVAWALIRETPVSFKLTLRLRAYQYLLITMLAVLTRSRSTSLHTWRSPRRNRMRCGWARRWIHNARASAASTWSRSVEDDPRARSRGLQGQRIVIGLRHCPTS
ncbi:hypothetical protein FB451DRAFT_1184028 [Mycena latifolia]|nr:hypothetical protein FB451DRAFT_1184028 [Mycena latifolia]